MKQIRYEFPSLLWCGRHVDHGPISRYNAEWTMLYKLLQLGYARSFRCRIRFIERPSS